MLGMFSECIKNEGVTISLFRQGRNIDDFIQWYVVPFVDLSAKNTPLGRLHGPGLSSSYSRINKLLVFIILMNYNI